jgi:hypothetical protein
VTALLLAITIGAALVQPGVSNRATQAIWLGTWRLDVAKSTYHPGPPPFKRATRTIERAGDWIKITDEMVRNRGGITHLEWTGRFDGLDYPVQGVEIVLTNAYRRIDDLTCELIQKIDDEVVATARMTISPDGKTVTTVNSGRTASATTIYEKA